MVMVCFCACCGIATTLTGWPGDACCFSGWSALSPSVTGIGIANTGMVISSAVVPALGTGTACAGPGSRFLLFST